jgi:tryptophan synthase alpha chain
MSRIESVFKAKNGTVFIGYLMAGHPKLEKLPELVRAMEDGGADMVEIGFPYSDPLADGPVIQEAGQIALREGATVDGIFDIIPEIRKISGIPLILMVYFSNIFRYGPQRFADRCGKAGIDGIIVPDMPLEERDEFLPLLPHGIAFIPLVAPTSGERISEIVKGAGGFIYCVSTLGVTGENGRFHPGLPDYLNNVRRLSPLPIAVGFGISRREEVTGLAPYTDGVIVGSALVKTIQESGGDPAALRSKVAELTGLG